jgi:RNA polymerase sigma-70 factor (ECF subfamily)
MTTPPEPERSNLDWVASLRADSESAWAAIRHQVHQSLVAYLRRNRPAGVTEGEVEAFAEDAVHDTLLRVRAKLGTFRHESRFTTWVHRVAVNVLLGQLRRRRWSPRSLDPSDDAVPDWPLDEAPAPDRAAFQRELWARIKQIIETELSAHQRRILLAHVFHQQPLDLLAADLGISRDAVYKAIHDARRKLRAALLAGGISLEDARQAFERGSS